MGIRPFVHFSIVFWLFTAFHHQRSTSSNFLIFHTPSGISSRLAAFLLLIDFRNVSCPSLVKCSNLILSRLCMISSIGLSVTYGDSLVCWFFLLVGWLAEREFGKRSKRNEDKSNFRLRFFFVFFFFVNSLFLLRQIFSRVS